jgi:hypothetical protein
MNFFSKIAAISSTLKGVLVLVVLAAIGVGGYFVYGLSDYWYALRPFGPELGMSWYPWGPPMQQIAE